MAHSLTITYSSTTITLTLVDYAPTSAPASKATVTEQWEVRVSGATVALLQTAIHQINRAFELARQGQAADHLDRVYINWQPSGYSASQRSRILDGQIAYYDETLKWAWADKALDVRLTIVRENFWEGAETAIPLSNSNGTDETDLLPIFNCNDGAGVSPAVQENTADIDADDLAGDLPAPLKLRVETDGELEDVIVCLNRSGTPADLQHMAEAEDAKSAVTDSDATCSGGEYAVGTFSETDEGVDVFTFTATEWPDLELGRWYLPFLRLRTVPTIADLWAQIQIVTGMDTETAWIQYPASGGPQMIQYPPILLGRPRWTTGVAYEINFRFKTSTSGTKTIRADYMAFLPLDGIRIFETTLNNGGVWDDPYLPLVFKWESLVLARGNPLMVDPRHDARLYVLSPGSTAVISLEMGVQALYRPRRLAL